MEPKKIGIGIGVGLLALVLAAPFALAHMGAQPYGYGMPGTMYWGPGSLHLTGAGGADPGSDFYDRMVEMHNSVFGTHYTTEEFERLHERVGCH